MSDYVHPLLWWEFIVSDFLRVSFVDSARTFPLSRNEIKHFDIQKFTDINKYSEVDRWTTDIRIFFLIQESERQRLIAGFDLPSPSSAFLPIFGVPPVFVSILLMQRENTRIRNGGMEKLQLLCKEKEEEE